MKIGSIVIHPKVQWTVIAGALVTVIIWILSLLSVSMPPEVAAALVLIIGGGAGYSAPKEPPPDVP